jgi:nucleoside-diphosphate-sugar epimerase
MKFLVTGAAGFIGFHTADRLCREGHEVVGIDNLNTYYSVDLKLARLGCCASLAISASRSSTSVTALAWLIVP